VHNKAKHPRANRYAFWGASHCTPKAPLNRAGVGGVMSMKNKSEFVEYLNEVFHNFGVIESKRMFGGYGIYRDGLMFGLVSDDVLYLKADSITNEPFYLRGLLPFEYQKGGKTMKISYYQAPEEIFDDLDMAKEWGDLAFGAALRARKSHNKSKQRNQVRETGNI
jgi:DNA transformation protein